MNLDLKGKRTLVTGSTAGIGFSIAKRLAAEGAEVVVNGRTSERVDDALEKLGNEADSATARGVAADLGTAEGCEQLRKEVPEIDILVNNLGIFEPKPFVEITDSDWENFFAVNVMSGVRLSRSYLPGMLKRNWGRIIFISSESGLQIPAEMIHYGMTKTAQLAIARGLAETCKSTAVTVNSVLPGPTASEGVTEFVAHLASQQKISQSEVEKEFFKTARPTSILQRFIETDEIAAVVAFLCSPLASAINGASIRADGGVVRSIG